MKKGVHVVSPKRRQSETSSVRNVVSPKIKCTILVRNVVSPNVVSPKRRQSETSLLRKWNALF
jgi:hypothetical protein